MNDPRVVIDAVEEALEMWVWTLEGVSLIISGGARGVDTVAEEFARCSGIPFEKFLPDYRSHGRYLAPKIRNCEMAERGDNLVAVRRNMSGGTTHMIEQMQLRGKPCHVKEII